ncbi:hypothetical protein LTR78_003050 [Recurvomyces mirabilis]|uniref:Heterokaryon incompatibility domain-containing protein n=1 Tax=Recurvomyces mirabilis TaxID=574656 RepID=A0AAE0WS87_9PEZI|nr:hypothetical protein LTR78_003050 [Recurvomyces mirabilis]KAK5157128.1 hypothetical protein LTS14_004646 [Recurvomyces mirabilis]
MRLLNTTDFSFQEFWTFYTTPAYAILSHRWSDEEVSFKIWRKGIGYVKIKKFCTVAKSFGFDWCWADTCCIDKRSSAELSEAVNSMYDWYKHSSLCITYLSDVHYNSEGPRTDWVFHDAIASMKHSEWFSRGWTLQELIAPPRILFLSSEWTILGHITSHFILDDGLVPGYPPLQAHISSITGIDVGILINSNVLEAACVAEKMSWAADRQTSRPEDMAYCLLGLFHVNMPLLYGEGATKAFMRLQLEIIRKSSDESIFAWREQSWTWQGLLSSSPKVFKHSGHIRRPNSIFVSLGDLTSAREVTRLPYAMTNRGLELRARAWRSFDKGSIYYIQLACEEVVDNGVKQSCMLVLQGVRYEDGDRVRHAQRRNTNSLDLAMDWQEPNDVESRSALCDLGIVCFEIPQDGL